MLTCAAIMRICCAVLVALAIGCGSSPVPAPPANADATPKVAPASAPLTTAATSATPVDLEAAARAAWAGRADRSELGRAIELWIRLSESRPGDPAPLTALSHAYIELADYHLRAPNDAAHRSDALERAIDCAERALVASSASLDAALKKGTPIDEAVKSVEANNVVVLATYGASLARYAIDKGFTALLMYRTRLLAVMQRVLEIAPATLYAIADRELGAYYARVPGFAGGDLAASRAHFDKALQLAPTALETRLRYAETYAVEARDRALFTKLLSEVATADIGAADVAPDNQLVKMRAASLAAATDELFPK